MWPGARRMCCGIWTDAAQVANTARSTWPTQSYITSTRAPQTTLPTYRPSTPASQVWAEHRGNIIILGLIIVA